MSSKWFKPRHWRSAGGSGDKTRVTICLKEWEALENLVEGAEDFMASRIDDMGWLRSAIDALRKGRKGRT